MTALKTKITTPHLEATRDFYVSGFGMAVLEEWDEDGDRGVILELVDGAREALLEIHDAPRAGDLSGLSLQFRVDDVEGFVSSISPELQFRGPVQRPWGSSYVYLTDPNGISVIVYQGGW
ncbi:MAG: VOC family protein [Acidimicrobiia bacterium]